MSSASTYQDFTANAFRISLLLVAISLPFAKNVNSYFIAAAAFFWLIQGNYAQKWQQLKARKWFLPFVIYYLVQVLSLLVSEDIAAAAFVLEKKSGLWVIPLLIASSQLRSKHIRHTLLAFAGATSLAILICLSAALGEWLSTGSSDQFFHHALASPIKINAIYLSLYAAFSCFVFAHVARSSAKYWLYLIPIPVLLIGLVLLASKMVLLLFLLAAIAFLFQHFDRQKQRMKAWGITALLLIVFGGSVFSIQTVRERFTSVMDNNFEVLQKDQFQHDSPFNGLNLRLLFWKISWEEYLAEGNWLLGSGIGDGQERLDVAYRRYGIYTGNADLGDRGYLGYNPHNQWMQALLFSGLIGLIAQLFIFSTAYRIFRNRGLLLLGLLLWLLLGLSMSESLLETHSGSVFFALMLALLMLHPQAEQ